MRATRASSGTQIVIKERSNNVNQSEELDRDGIGYVQRSVQPAMKGRELTIILIDHWQVRETLAMRSVEYVLDATHIVNECAAAFESRATHLQIQANRTAIGGATTHCLDCFSAKPCKTVVYAVPRVANGEMKVLIRRQSWNCQPQSFAIGWGRSRWKGAGRISQPLDDRRLCSSHNFTPIGQR